MRTKDRKKPEPLDFAANAGIGALIALGSTLVLLLAASLLVVSGRLLEGWMEPLTVLVLFGSSFLGALIAIRRNRSRALIVGIAQGAMLYAITFIGGVFAEVPALLGPWSFFLFAAALLGGVAAGLLSARPKRRKL